MCWDAAGVESPLRMWAMLCGFPVLFCDKSHMNTGGSATATKEALEFSVRLWSGWVVGQVPTFPWW